MSAHTRRWEKGAVVSGPRGSGGGGGGELLLLRTENPNWDGWDGGDGGTAI